MAEKRHRTRQRHVQPGSRTLTRVQHRQPHCEGTLATFGIIVSFFRMISLASIVSALFAVFWAWSLFGIAPITPVVGAIALLLIWRHRENILRLASGTEPRLGEKKTS